MSFRERGPRGPYRPKPVAEGETYDVTVEATSRRGDGVARIQGFVIFIPGATVGEHVKAKITRVTPRFAIAEKVA